MPERKFKVWLTIDVNYADGEQGDIEDALAYVRNMEHRQIGEEAIIMKVERL